MPPSPSDPPGLDRDVARVYGELRRLARRLLDRERDAHTIDSRALVAEAYARLARQEDLSWANRPHLMAICARTMRAVLVDYARARMAQKRGGPRVAVTLHTGAGARTEPFERLLDLEDALERLGRVNEEALRVVEVRYFGGLTLPETADALGLSVATTRRRWQFAKVWLRRELG